MSALNTIRQAAYDIAFDDNNPMNRTESLFVAMTDILVDHEHFHGPQWANLKLKAGRSLAEAHGFDIDEQMGIVTLFYVIDAHCQQDLDADWTEQTCGKIDVEKALKALRALVELAASTVPPNLGEHSITAGDLWEHLAKRKDAPSKIALCILSTGKFTKDGWGASVGGLHHTMAWDMDRLKGLVEGRADSVEVDFAKYDGGIHCLLGGQFSAEAGMADENTHVYLGVLPGDCLADIYFEHRTRLLQHNVRAFLNFSGGVNKGMRKTIKEEPSRFLAYNNGVAATASAVEVESVAPGVYKLLKAMDFQIVNGGQTTASLLHTRLLGEADTLESVKVAMKLTVVSSESLAGLVPKISKYANSQNKIQESDFDSSAPWFGELESISRRLEASGNEESGGQPIRWFFERMRGQYNVELGRQITPARKRAFQSKNPKSSVFAKTDLAAAFLAWTGKPDISCQGIQKCFKIFMKLLITSDITDPLPTEENFKMLCCLLISFREGERLFREAGKKDLRSQSIKYALALLGNSTDLNLPFAEIWRLQRLPDSWREDFRTAILFCHKVLENQDAPNKTEGAKNAGLWAALKERDFPIRSQNLGECQRLSFADILSTTVREKSLEILFKVPREAWEQIAKIGWIDKSYQQAALKIAKAAGKSSKRVKPDLAKSGALGLIALGTKPEIGQKFKEYFSGEEWIRIQEMAKWTGVEG